MPYPLCHVSLPDNSEWIFKTYKTNVSNSWDSPSPLSCQISHHHSSSYQGPYHKKNNILSIVLYLSRYAENMDFLDFLAHHLYWPLLLANPLDSIQCWQRADECKFLLMTSFQRNPYKTSDWAKSSMKYLKNL